MKVILNQDVKHLGELGDVKNVANGYARNYLFPRMYAVPYNAETVAYFEGRKEEIEARKEQKRKDSASLKERLEGLKIELVMPAGANGRLYGAVSSLTIADYLTKHGFEVERKRIEVPGVTIKTVGSYHATVRLYEAQSAELTISVKAQDTDETKAAPEKNGRSAAEAAKEMPMEQDAADIETTAE